MTDSSTPPERIDHALLALLDRLGFFAPLVPRILASARKSSITPANYPGGPAWLARC